MADSSANDEIAETYDIQSLEQLRAVADDLRVRILDAATERAMTASEIAKKLGQPPNKIHYHVRELERVGLLRLVETREKGGVLEKYYRAVAKTFNTPAELLKGATPDELTITATELIRSVTQGWLRALRNMLRRAQPEPGRTPYRALSLSASDVWMTDAEVEQLGHQIAELLASYGDPRGIEGEHERMLAWLAYDLEAATSEPEVTPLAPELAPAPSARPTRVSVAGAAVYRASDLEQALATGRQLDLLVVGLCTFTNDVTPDLVDAAIARFRVRGVLTAAPEVREALKRKEAKPTSS